MARKSRKLQRTAGVTDAVNISPKFNVAAYVRLSVEDNNLDDGYSIEAQKEMLISYIDGQEDMSLYAVHCDNGFTGSNFDRDDFKRMMDDIKSGKVNAFPSLKTHLFLLQESAVWQVVLSEFSDGFMPTL